MVQQFASALVGSQFVNCASRSRGEPLSQSVGRRARARRSTYREALCGHRTVEVARHTSYGCTVHHRSAASGAARPHKFCISASPKRPAPSARWCLGRNRLANQLSTPKKTVAHRTASRSNDPCPLFWSKHAFNRRWLTNRSTGHFAAYGRWASFHSRPTAARRKMPVSSNVRRRSSAALLPRQR